MRQLLYIISDLHLGGAPASATFPSFQMCSPKGRACLAAFIRAISLQQTPVTDVHLLINGDVVDFLAEAPFAAFTGDGEAARQKLEAVFATTAEVWDALRLLLSKGSALTILLGNHDLELCLPAPRRALLQRLGPGRVEILYDNQAFTLGPVLVEHGNRYDSWNVVNHDLFRELRSSLSRREPPPPFKAPAGSELVTRVMNPLKARYPWVDLLKPEKEAALPLLAVLDPSALKSITEVVGLYWNIRGFSLDDEARPQFRELISAPAGRDEAGPQLRSTLAARSGGPAAPTTGAGELRAPEARTLEMLALAQSLAGADPTPLRDAPPGPTLARGLDGPALRAGRGEVSSFKKVNTFLELWSASREAADREAQVKRLAKAFRALVDEQKAFNVNQEEDTWLVPARKAAARGFSVVVYGHTHLLRRVALDGGARYLNTGTWADLMVLPPAVLRGTEAEATQSLLGFVGDMVSGKVDAWRRLVPSFARVTLEGDRVLEADIFLFNPDQPNAPKAIKDGLFEVDKV